MNGPLDLSDELDEALAITVVATGSNYTVRHCLPNLAENVPGWFEVDMVWPHSREALTEAISHVPELLDLDDAEIDSSKGTAVFFFGRGDEDL